MNVKKIKLDEVKNGSVNEVLVRKEFIRCVNEMESAFNSFEHPIDFYICLEQEFDKGKSKGALLVIGKRKNSWKAYLNGQAKDGTQKKKILWGECYLETMPDGSKVLQLMPEKGAAKLEKLKKEAKELLKKANVKLGIPKGFTIPDQEEVEEEKPIPEPQDDRSPNQKLEDELKANASTITKTFKALNTMKDKKELTKSIYKIHELHGKFEVAVSEYNKIGGEQATEKILPGVATKLASLIAQMEEKYNRIFMVGDTFKKHVAQLNQVLKAVNQPTINI